MSTTITTAEDRKPSIGQFRIVTRTYDNTDMVIGVHRGEELRPGAFTGAGNWKPTDVSGHPASIQQAAKDMWTTDAINACKAAYPWVPPAPPPDPLTFSVTRRQINAALITAAVTTAPDTWMDGLLGNIADPTAQALAVNDWNNAPNFTRSSPLFNDPGLMTAANMTAEQIDALWALAVTLPA